MADLTGMLPRRCAWSGTRSLCGAWARVCRAVAAPRPPRRPEWLSWGERGNSSHPGIIHKCVRLSQSGVRGRRQLVRACASARGEAAGWLALDLVPSFTGRTDFLKSVGPALMFYCRLPAIHLMAARAKTMRRSNCFVGCSLLLEAPSRGKEVTRQLLSLGQIPGVFLKEMGCREKRPGLCTATQRCPAHRHLPCWAGDDALLGTWWGGRPAVPPWFRAAAQCWCPFITSRFKRLRVYFLNSRY